VLTNGAVPAATRIDDLQAPPAGLAALLLAHGGRLAVALVDHLDAHPVGEHLEPELDLALAVLERVGDELAADEQRPLDHLLGQPAVA
jgi:hypothetical protein